jgi:hypothetical protein
MLKDIKSKMANDPKKINKKGPNPTDEELLKMDDNYVPFTFRQYKDHKEILAYIKNDNYMIQKSKPGVCFGFSITDNKIGDVDVKLAFSGTEEDSSR